MVDARWLDIIEKFEGIEGLRPSIDVDNGGQDNSHLSPNVALLNRKKLVLTGAIVVFFILLMKFVVT